MKVFKIQKGDDDLLEVKVDSSPVYKGRPTLGACFADVLGESHKGDVVELHFSDFSGAFVRIDREPDGGPLPLTARSEKCAPAAQNGCPPESLRDSGKTYLSDAVAVLEAEAEMLRNNIDVADEEQRQRWTKLHSVYLAISVLSRRNR